MPRRNRKTRSNPMDRVDFMTNYPEFAEKNQRRKETSRRSHRYPITGQNGNYKALQLARAAVAK